MPTPNKPISWTAISLEVGVNTDVFGCGISSWNQRLSIILTPEPMQYISSLSCGLLHIPRFLNLLVVAHTLSLPCCWSYLICVSTERIDIVSLIPVQKRKLCCRQEGIVIVESREIWAVSAAALGKPNLGEYRVYMLGMHRTVDSV